MLCERVEKAVDILLAFRGFVYGAIPVLRHLRAGQKFNCGPYPLRVLFAGFVPSCGTPRGLLVIAAL